MSGTGSAGSRPSRAAANLASQGSLPTILDALAAEVLQTDALAAVQIVTLDATGRRLTWEPARVAVSPGEGVGDPGLYRWGYELFPDGPGATMVTETFDCTRSARDLREAVQEGEGWRDAMTASLAKLELLARAAAQSGR